MGLGLGLGSVSGSVSGLALGLGLGLGSRLPPRRHLPQALDPLGCHARRHRGLTLGIALLCAGLDALLLRLWPTAGGRLSKARLTRVSSRPVLWGLLV